MRPHIQPISDLHKQSCTTFEFLHGVPGLSIPEPGEAIPSLSPPPLDLKGPEGIIKPILLFLNEDLSPLTRALPGTMDSFFFHSCLAGDT